MAQKNEYLDERHEEVNISDLLVFMIKNRILILTSTSFFIVAGIIATFLLPKTQEINGIVSKIDANEYLSTNFDKNYAQSGFIIFKDSLQSGIYIDDFIKLANSKNSSDNKLKLFKSGLNGFSIRSENEARFSFSIQLPADIEFTAILKEYVDFVGKNASKRALDNLQKSTGASIDSLRNQRKLLVKIGEKLKNNLLERVDSALSFAEKRKDKTVYILNLSNDIRQILNIQSNGNNNLTNNNSPSMVGIPWNRSDGFGSLDFKQYTHRELTQLKNDLSLSNVSFLLADLLVLVDFQIEQMKAETTDTASNLSTFSWILEPNTKHENVSTRRINILVLFAFTGVLTGIILSILKSGRKYFKEIVTKARTEKDD